MARKQVSIQDTIETNEEFENYLSNHYNQLICMEVYSEFCGNSMAMSNAVRKAKLEIGNDKIAAAKAAADKITALSRFKGRSEPVFLFIQKGQLTRAMFGADGVKLCQIAEDELALKSRELETGEERPKFPIEYMSQEEARKREEDSTKDLSIQEAERRLRTLTLQARKRRVCERLHHAVRRYNFILFWPRCHQAHYDLYEKWDDLNIHVTAKDTFHITEQDLNEVFYMSDIDANEACVNALTTGEALVVLFKMFETDNRDFVQLMRQALYEETPRPKEDVPLEKQPPLVPAYERYASISKTKREVRRDRHNEKLRKLREEREERERLAAEQARLARQQEEDRLLAEAQRKEEERIARIQAGVGAVYSVLVGQREEREERERLAAEQARLARQQEEDRLLAEAQRKEEERIARIQAGVGAVYSVLVGQREEREERERLAAEQARLARQQEEDRLLAEAQRKEEERIARIQAGLPVEPEEDVVGGEQGGGETEDQGEAAADGAGVDDVTPQPDAQADGDADVSPAAVDGEMVVEEEQVDDFHSDVSLEGEEYIPPGGLFVPGFYCPPNNLARANGLVFFYPKIISTLTTIETPYLPPHVLVMFPADKREEVKAIMQDYRDDILNVGLFVGDDPATAEHIAYTIKQYDKMERPRKHKDRLAMSVSRRRSLALLQLAGLNPCYISADNASGERDCLKMFPVGYGDDYIEEISLIEEVETPVEAETRQEEGVEEQQKENNSEENDDETE